MQVDAQLVNYSDEELDVSVHGRINDQVKFEQRTHLGPKEIKEIAFTPDEYTQLNVKNPRIWWPWQYGGQELNSIELEVKRNG